MKRYLSLLLIAGIASAATGPTSITFVRPTLYTDGSAMPASAIASYQVGCEFTPTGSTVPGPCALSSATIPGGSTTGTMTLTYPATGGDACFVLRTVTTAGVTSIDSSPKACKTLTPVAPNPPTNVTVTITLALDLTSNAPIQVALSGVPVVTKTP